MNILQNHRYPVNKVKFSPHMGWLLGSASFDMDVHFYDLRDAVEPLKFKGSQHTEFVYSLDFNMFDEKLVASVGWDGRILVWPFDQPQPMIPWFIIHNKTDKIVSSGYLLFDELRLLFRKYPFLIVLEVLLNHRLQVAILKANHLFYRIDHLGDAHSLPDFYPVDFFADFNLYVESYLHLFHLPPSSLLLSLINAKFSMCIFGRLPLRQCIDPVYFSWPFHSLEVLTDARHIHFWKIRDRIGSEPIWFFWDFLIFIFLMNNLYLFLRLLFFHRGVHFFGVNYF